MGLQMPYTLIRQPLFFAPIFLYILCAHAQGVLLATSIRAKN
jgi:hypothetical protein